VETCVEDGKPLPPAGSICSAGKCIYNEVDADCPQTNAGLTPLVYTSKRLSYETSGRQQAIPKRVRSPFPSESALAVQASSTQRRRHCRAGPARRADAWWQVQTLVNFQKVTVLGDIMMPSVALAAAPFRSRRGLFAVAYQPSELDAVRLAITGRQAAERHVGGPYLGWIAKAVLARQALADTLAPEVPPFERKYFLRGSSSRLGRTRPNRPDQRGPADWDVNVAGILADGRRQQVVAGLRADPEQQQGRRTGDPYWHPRDPVAPAYHAC
jgi:hypothetical protein